VSLFLPHIYGQEKVQKEWKSLLKNNRFPHTLILYGDDGLGKTTAAFDLAGILTGESEKISGEFDELHISSAREEMTLPMAGNRLWYLRPGKMELKVEQFRTFLESMASFDEKAHVCIIDECQFMRAAAANIMLKTLEEPQSNVYYILISTDELHSSDSDFQKREICLYPAWKGRISCTSPKGKQQIPGAGEYDS
jgi:DNA polymerase-3 subunit delta'